jgi:hypothetical protein
MASQVAAQAYLKMTETDSVVTFLGTKEIEMRFSTLLSAVPIISFASTLSYSSPVEAQEKNHARQILRAKN